MNDKGQGEIRPKYLRLESNLRFAFRMYAFVLGKEYQLTANGFQVLKEAIRVRNRITHPKSSRDILVNNRDIELVQEVAVWFAQNLHGLITAEGRLDKEVAKLPPVIS